MEDGTTYGTLNVMVYGIGLLNKSTLDIYVFHPDTSPPMTIHKN